MKKITDIFIWALLLFLITPSGMALASWNAVPGDATYPWKLSLEKALLLFMSPSSKLASTTQVKITERRFSELEQTLSGAYAFESLDNLEKQMETTTSNIQKINQQATQDQVKEQYITSLRKMSSSLNEQKSKIAAGESPAMVQKNTNPNNKVVNNKNPNTNVVPTSAPPNPTPESPPSNEELIDEIEKTEKKIEEIIIVIEDTTVIETETKIEIEDATINIKNNARHDNNDNEEDKKPKAPKDSPPRPKNDDRKTPSIDNSGNSSNSTN